MPKQFAAHGAADFNSCRRFAECLFSDTAAWKHHHRNKTHYSVQQYREYGLYPLETHNTVPFQHGGNHSLKELYCWRRKQTVSVMHFALTHSDAVPAVGDGRE